jgi:hypothetical protein
LDRRSFLEAGAGALGFLRRLTPVGARESRLGPDGVRFDPAIEPLVRLLEETPRETLLEEVAARIGKGLGYRELLAALLLAGIRNIQPRPSVGFKFHAVLAVHSAHLVAQASPASDRWLPLFWALDQFKRSEAADLRGGDWTMPAPGGRTAPAKEQAVRAFTTAMERWDERGADAAAAGLARSQSAEEVLELLARYAARDFRSIGHKAIYVANGFRTLETIGWRHAEPVVRSIAYALLAREGSDPLNGDDRADRPWRRNRELLKRIRPEWQGGRLDSGATAEMLSVLREGTEVETADAVVALLDRGLAPETIWDGLLCGAAELLMRNPGILSLHAVTTTNAIRHLYGRVRSDETRRALLLQNASFLPFYRRAGVAGARIDELSPTGTAVKSVEEIAAAVGRDNAEAARRVLAYLKSNEDPAPLLDAFNRLVFLKGNDSHDYKFSAAVLEDEKRLSPAWRGRYLAASVYWLNGSSAPDNELIERARRAFVT